MRRLLWITLVLFGGLSSLIAIVNLWIIVTTSDLVVPNTDPISPRSFAIVLGAGVHGDTLSDALRARMMRAIDLYRAKQVGKILISGDGTDRFYNEPKAMRAFAQQNAIPDEILAIDNHGFSTYSTLSRARKEFGVESAYIISQSYHLPRAVWIARKVGISARGVAVADPKDSFFMHVREVLARTKDFFLVSLKTEPPQTREMLF